MSWLGKLQDIQVRLTSSTRTHLKQDRPPLSANGKKVNMQRMTQATNLGRLMPSLKGKMNTGAQAKKAPRLIGGRGK